jgi:D-sedoheptulose 7-phosphate isomerase
MEEHLREHLAVFSTINEFFPQVEKASSMAVVAIKNQRKIMFAGNGGSAADAQHLAAELVGRLEKERVSLPGLALSTDTSALTCIGNDYGFEQVFSRQVEGLGAAGDVLVVISTSGNSENLVRAAIVSKARGIYTIGLLGKGGGRLASLVDLPIVIPSANTARIQEAHIFLGHLMCGEIENQLLLNQ